MTSGAANGRTPDAGNAGSDSPGPTGTARLRPVLVNDDSSTDTKSREPSRDHAEWQ
jgi:hypothetical protein